MTQDLCAMLAADIISLFILLPSLAALVRWAQGGRRQR